MAFNRRFRLSQTGEIKQIQKILDLSEHKLIQVLEGKTSLKERDVVNVALEIYKRKVPQETKRVEAAKNTLTMIKVVKNFNPSNPESGDVVDVTPSQEKLEQMAEERIDDTLETIMSEEKRVVLNKNFDSQSFTKMEKKKFVVGDFDEFDEPLFQKDKKTE